jgi:hypothetical protein
MKEGNEGKKGKGRKGRKGTKEVIMDGRMERRK